MPHDCTKEVMPNETRTRSASEVRSSLKPEDFLRASLREFQSRVARALDLIAEARAYGTIGVSWSGGKDSTVLLDLVRQIDPHAPAAWFDSGAELASTRELCARIGSVEIIHPQYSLPEMCRYGGYWGYPSPADAAATFDFTEVLVLEPARRFAAGHSLACHALGLRGGESTGRWKSMQVHGELHQYVSGIWRVCPLMSWSTADVWAYIASRSLDYNHAYDRMTDLGISREQQRVSNTLTGDARRAGRFTYLKRIDPELWNQLTAEFPKLRAYA